LTEQRRHLTQHLDNLELLRRSVTDERSYLNPNDPAQLRVYSIYRQYMTARLLGLEQVAALVNDINYDLRNANLSINAIESSIALLEGEQDPHHNRLALMDLEAALKKAKATADFHEQRVELVTTLPLEKLKYDTLVGIHEQKAFYHERLRDVDYMLRAASIHVEQATFTSPTAGVVNILTPVMPGQWLASGINIVAVIPDTESEFKVLLQVLNKDISRVELGQVVRLRLLALPYREYGEFTGTVQRIAADASVNRNTSVSYYVVEASIGGTTMQNYSGTITEIRAGMLCEARVVTGTKGILRWLLEKMNLVF